jgi:hypothetical protein
MSSTAGRASAIERALQPGIHGLARSRCVVCAWCRLSGPLSPGNRCTQTPLRRCSTPRIVACGTGPTRRPPTLHRARGRGSVTTARKTDPIRRSPPRMGEPVPLHHRHGQAVRRHVISAAIHSASSGRPWPPGSRSLLIEGEEYTSSPPRSWWLRPSKPSWTDGTSGRALSEALRTASDSCRTGSATFSFQPPTKTPGQTGDRTPGQWLQNCNVQRPGLSGRSVKTLGRILASPVPFALLTGSDQYARKGIAGYFMTSVVS